MDVFDGSARNMQSLIFDDQGMVYSTTLPSPVPTFSLELHGLDRGMFPNS